MTKEIQEATDFLASRINIPPQIGMITGTGLGDLTEKIEADFRLPYEEIPHFSTSTIPGHKGTLVFGRLGNRQILAMEGRFHLYEGYTLKEITFPIRIMSGLGVKYLFISSAAKKLSIDFSFSPRRRYQLPNNPSMKLMVSLSSAFSARGMARS